MTPKPLTIEPDADIREAARILVTRRIRRLPLWRMVTWSVSSLLLISCMHSKLKIKDEIKDTYTSLTFALWEETPSPLSGELWKSPGVDAIPILDAENRCRASSLNGISSGVQVLKIVSV